MEKREMTKDEILNKIREAAKASGGQPPGIKRFTDITGIRPWVWGKYWTKFGDALIEAGFERNKPWTRYPEGFLEERIIPVIRRLGKYPTQSEMRLQHFENPEVPYNYLKKRRRDDFIRTLVRYCEKTPGYDDILDICRPIIDKFNEPEAEGLINNSTAREGQVYLYKRGKYYKIGYSKDPVRRGKEMRADSPDPLKFIHSIPTNDPSGVEAYWHNRFKSKRIEGEFFKLDRKDIDEFKRWKRM